MKFLIQKSVLKRIRLIGYESQIHFWSKVLLRLWSEIAYWYNFKMDQNRNSARDYKFRTKLQFSSAFKFLEWALLVRIRNKTMDQKYFSNTFLDQKMNPRVRFSTWKFHKLKRFAFWMRVRNCPLKDLEEYSWINMNMGILWLGNFS